MFLNRNGNHSKTHLVMEKKIGHENGNGDQISLRNENLILRMLPIKLTDSPCLVEELSSHPNSLDNIALLKMIRKILVDCNSMTRLQCLWLYSFCGSDLVEISMLFPTCKIQRNVKYVSNLDSLSISSLVCPLGTFVVLFSMMLFCMVHSLGTSCRISAHKSI